MPTLKLRFPSSPSLRNSAKNSVKVETDKKTKNTIPSRAEYAGQAARDVVDILVAVAQTVPVPALGAAVKVGAGIIKACDEGHAILDRAEELKVRIEGLFVLLVNELKGKKVEDMQETTIRDIDALQKDMEYIKTKLDEILSQHQLLLVVFRTLNEDKVNKCFATLNHSLERFNLARNIEHTKMLSQFKQQIIAFSVQQQNSLDMIEVKMDDVKAILDERLPPIATPHIPSRAPIPANSTIFYGRDSVVIGLVSIIIGTSRKHICLLGPGGMGKTATSLAVTNHPDVKVRFANHLRVWVPCIKATSVSLFLDTIHSSLAIPTKTGDIRALILSELQASPPIILLLDNLETPWNVLGAQSEIERFIRDIHEIRHVTLFATMRASTPPCGDIPWHNVNLQAIDAAASREIYTTWHPEGCEDPGLPHLLNLVGHMPLAVMLLAKVAKVTHLSAEELAEEYNKVGTPMLGQGSDAESSMDVCIGLSVYSSRMKARPEAYDLLCALSMLPTGTSYRMLSKWWASNLSNLAGAIEVLKNTSLVEEGGSRYFVLPVIQRFILDPSHFNGKIRTSMIETACAFLMAHKSNIGDPFYKTHITALSAEEGNLEAVLLQATTPDIRIIRDGLLLLAHYQRHNRPQLDVVEHAIRLVHGIHDNPGLRGEILLCSGEILLQLGQYDKSLQQCEEALDLFLSVPDREKAAKCRINIAKLMSLHGDGDYDSQETAIQDALADCIQDQDGYGHCLFLLGDLDGRHGRSSSALIWLNQAERILAKGKNSLVHADCTRSLAFNYYKTGQYDLAHSWAVSSLKEYESIGNLAGCSDAAAILGFIASAREDYKGSFEHFLHSLRDRKVTGLAPLGDTLEAMGCIWVKSGKNTDARRAFEESLQHYSSEEFTEHSQYGIVRTQFFLGRLENPEVDPSTDELVALRRLYAQTHIDKILAPIQ
ncbi:hypothetical protein C0993_003067 [Termitomyces sp. T159_Od127]|nr:hypothetical protein C0993_003067 [Termitomyces sp. T159_Od127]